jgi:hypothetical protein
MSVTVTLAFATAAEAAATLAKLGNAAPAATTAPTARTASAEKADAPAKKEEPSAKLDFATVKEKLMAYNKKADKDTFGATMKKFGAKGIGDIEKNPAIWADLVAVCDAA